MDSALDPSLMRLAGDGGLPPAALQALLQNPRAAANNTVQQSAPAQQYQQMAAPAPQAINLFSQLLANPASLAQLQSLQDVTEAEARPNRSGRARSGGDSRQAGTGVLSVTYASRHQQAEARRRSRINERLEALRRVVPHSERANTATFLEELLKYVEGMQARVLDLEMRLGLEPKVKEEPAARHDDAILGTEATVLPGGSSDPRIAQPLPEQQQRQQRQQQQQQQQQQMGLDGSGRDTDAAGAQQNGAVELPCLGGLGFLSAGMGTMDADAPAAATGRGSGRGSAGAASAYTERSARSGSGAGGDDLPSISEELAMAAALQAPSRGGSAAAAAMMAESAPPPAAAAMTALAQLAHQAGRQRGQEQLEVGMRGNGGGGAPSGRLGGFYTAAQELAVAAARAGSASQGASTSPFPSTVLQQAAQALLGKADPSISLQGYLAQQQPQRLGGRPLRQLSEPQQQLFGSSYQEQLQQWHFMHAFGGGGGEGDHANPAMPSFLTASGSSSGGPDPSVQLHFHLLAAQQAAEQVARQAQHGQPRTDLSSAPQPHANPLNVSAPAPSVSALMRPPLPSSVAVVAAGCGVEQGAGRELSNSGRSQQTRQMGGGDGLPPAFAAAEPALNKRGVAGDALLPEDAKRRKLHARPAVSF